MKLHQLLAGSVVLTLCSLSLWGQSYVYDEAGRLTRVVYPQGGGIGYTYDDADNLLRSVLLSLPPAPSDVSATRLSETQARVSWPATQGATGYVIERRTEGSGQWQQIATVGPDATQFIDTTLQAGTNYYYRIAANSSDGTSAYSKQAGFGTLGSPQISTNGIKNGAGFAVQPLAPGSVISIFGPNLGLAPTDFGGVAPIFEVAGAPPLPNALGDYSVTIDGIPAPLFFVGRGEGASQGQINAQIPWSARPGTREVVVSHTVDGNVLESDPYMLDIASVGPGIFTFAGDANAPAIAVAVNYSPPNSDVIPSSVAAPEGTFPNFPAQPAARGGLIILYATGLGPVSPPATNGADSSDALRSTTIPLSVYIGNAKAEVPFSGLTPQFPGVNQLNVIIPQAVVPGDAVPIRIEQGGVSSQDNVVIAVR